MLYLPIRRTNRVGSVTALPSPVGVQPVDCNLTQGHQALQGDRRPVGHMRGQVFWRGHLLLAMLDMLLLVMLMRRVVSLRNLAGERERVVHWCLALKSRELGWLSLDQFGGVCIRKDFTADTALASRKCVFVRA